MRATSHDGTMVPGVLNRVAFSARARAMGQALCETWSRVIAMNPPVRCHDQQPRHRGCSPQSRALHVMTWMLSGVTLIALLSLSSLFVAPHPLVARERPSDLIYRFYAATNAILAGGSPAALERIVAPDLIDHRPGLLSGDRATLVRRLTDLHRAAPEAQLGVVAVVEDGTWAAARVRPRGLRRAVHDVPLDLAPEPPTQIEFFRIVDDTIVEYWQGGSAIDVPHALPTITVAPWMTNTAVSLARLTFPPGAVLRDLAAPGEHLLLLQRGELAVNLGGAATRFEAARPEAGWQPTPAAGQDLVLQAGDALLIPPRTRHAIANVRADAATALGMAMVPTAALATPESQHDGGDAQLVAIYDPGRVGTQSTWDQHVRVEVLVSSVGEARPGPCAAVAQTQVNVTRFTLGPGEGLPTHPVAGIELLAIDTDGLEIDTPYGVTITTPVAELANARPQGREMAQGPALGLSFPSPSAPPVRNAGPLPLTLVGVAFQPTGGTLCAVAPIDS